MKSTLNVLTLMLTTIIFANAQSPTIDSVFMGAGYVNQIYYKLNTGQTGQQVSTSWQLAVSVQPSIPPTQTLQGTTIRINGGYGVEIFKVTDTDSSGFLTLNSTANLSSWKQLRDSYTNWDEGCLNSTRSSSDPFDYGWGKYLGNPSYNVVGDSIYVLKYGNNEFKKLWIKKLQFDTLWNIVFSDLDNSNMNNLHFSKAGQGLQGKNFVYIDMSAGLVQNAEPNNGWDLLFGKYLSEVAPGMLYSVVGVLTNKPVQSVKATHVDFNSVNYVDYSQFLTSNISNIGFDWKVFENNAYSMVDSLVYFVKTGNGQVFRLRFLAFRSIDGMVKFELIPASGVSVQNMISTNYVEVFPNPTSSMAHLISEKPIRQILVLDLSGREWMRVNEIQQHNYNLNMSLLQSGIYFVQCITEDGISIQKIVKQ